MSRPLRDLTEIAPIIIAMRADGYSWKSIGDRFDVVESTARQWGIRLELAARGGPRGRGNQTQRQRQANAERARARWADPVWRERMTSHRPAKQDAVPQPSWHCPPGLKPYYRKLKECGYALDLARAVIDAEARRGAASAT